MKEVIKRDIRLRAGGTRLCRDVREPERRGGPGGVRVLSLLLLEASSEKLSHVTGHRRPLKMKFKWVSTSLNCAINPSALGCNHPRGRAHNMSSRALEQAGAGAEALLPFEAADRATNQRVLAVNLASSRLLSISGRVKRPDMLRRACAA